MSSENEDIEQIARRDLRLTIDDIVTLIDAASALGLEADATEEEIQTRFQRLVFFLHPDSSPFDDVDKSDLTNAFRVIINSRDSLIEVPREQRIQRSAQEARVSGAPSSPGTGGWGAAAEERREQYKQTYEEIRIFFVEQFLNINISSDTLGEALRKQEVGTHEIDMLEDILRENFGIPELTLDDIARVTASLITTGNIRLGNVSRMAEQMGRFQRGGHARFGASDTGRFSRRSRRRWG